MKLFYDKFPLFFVLVCLAFNAYGQQSLDTITIDRLLLKLPTDIDTSFVDLKVIGTIKAFDRHFFEILSNDSNYAIGKRTVMCDRPIKVRKLINRSAALANIINDTAHYGSEFNFKTFWGKFNGDTTRFLSDILVKREFELYYPTCQSPKEYMTIKPTTITPKLDLTHFIFYTDSLNQKIQATAKQLSKKQRLALWKYLGRKYNDFYPSKERLYPSAITISDITFSTDRLIYVGADIYGVHYLLTFDESKDYKFESKKELWVN